MKYNVSKKGLLGQALITYCGLVLATLTALTMLFVLTLESSFQKQVDLKARSVAELLAAESGQALLAGDRQILSSIAANALSIDDVVYVKLTDSRGSVVQAARTGFPLSAIPRLTGGPFVGSRRRALRIGNSPFAVVEAIWASAAGPDRSVRTIQVGLSTQDQQQTLTHLIRYAIAGAFGAIATMILLHFLHLRRLLRPLKTLVAFTKKVGGGDLTQLAPIVRRDEVGGLAVAFNQMVQELRESQDHLILLLKEAQEANRVKNDFLANMSHELRTPLNGVIGFTQLVLADTTIGPDNREYLETVESSAVSLLKLIEDILDLSKIEADRLDLDLAPFAIRDCVKGAVQTLSMSAGQKGLDLTWTVDPGIPEEVVGDCRRLRQVLLNLIGNGIKFTSNGSVRVEVAPKPNAGRELMVEFIVSDTGIGIPAGQQKVIFEPFRQVDGSTTRMYGGAGLGLAISARLVATMGGDIWVMSEPGRGSTFHFTSAFKLPEAVPADAAAISVPGRGAPLSVLVAGANPLSQLLVTSFLEEWGHNVTHAATGPEVLSILQRQAFDLILMDLELPEIDGLQSTVRIREEERRMGRHIPIIAMSAHSLKTERRRSMEAGVDGYVTKPIYPKELLALITGIRAKNAPQQQEVTV